MPNSGNNSMELPRPFGPYSLLQRLAVGGMAEVYIATARGIGGFEKLVAIKVIHPRYSEDEHFVRMLVEEAKLSVLLNHVNVAQTFDLACIDGTYCIVMEYIDGADVYRLLRRASERRIPIPIDIAAFVAAEMCNGLDYAHRKRDVGGRPLKIVHRDISPQNVLISFAGEVKIVDFGIAKAALRTGNTEAGVIKGKYYYMSPEQAWADPMDHRSDIFSSGIVLYEMLTGQMLYKEESLPKLLDRVRKAEIPAPSSKREEIPRQLDDIVLKALAKEPGGRFSSAHEFGQTLTNFLYHYEPAFTAGRLTGFMNSIFDPEVDLATTDASGVDMSNQSQATEHTQDHGGTRGTLDAMRAEEFRPDPVQSVIFDVGGDDDVTRRDIVAQIEPTTSAASGAGASEKGGMRRAGRSREQATAELPLEQVSSARAHLAVVSTTVADDVDDSETLVDAKQDLNEITAPIPPKRSTASLGEQKSRSRARPSPPPIAAAHATGNRSSRPPRLWSSRPPSSHPPSSRPPSSHPPSSRPPSSHPPSSHPPSSHPPSSRSPGSRAAGPPQGSPERDVTLRPGAARSGRSSSAPSPSRKTQSSSAVANRSSSPPATTSPASLSRSNPASSDREERPETRASGSSDSSRSKSIFITRARPAIRTVSRSLMTQRFFWPIVGAGALIVGLTVGAWVAVRPTRTNPSLDIISVPPGATVELDGTVLPQRTPVRAIPLERPGEMSHVEIRLDGYEPWSTDFRQPEHLAQQIAVLTPRRVTLWITTEPDGGEVWVDGTKRGTSPVQVPNLPIGRELVVQASLEGYATVMQNVRVTSNEDEPRLTLRFTRRR